FRAASVYSGAVRRRFIDLIIKELISLSQSRASIVDGFPPRAWQTCADWMKAHQANNEAIHATLGVLSIGKSLYADVRANSAYLIYPVTFTDAPNGKKVTYKGAMAVTLERTQNGWVFTGIASAWTT